MNDAEARDLRQIIHDVNESLQDVSEDPNQNSELHLVIQKMYSLGQLPQQFDQHDVQNLT